MGLFKKTEKGELGAELFRRKIDFWSFVPPEGCADQYEAVMRRSFPDASYIHLLYREIAPDKGKSLLEWTVLPVDTFKIWTISKITGTTILWKKTKNNIWSSFRGKRSLPRN